MKALLTKTELDWLQSFKPTSNHPLAYYVHRINAVVFAAPSYYRKKEEYSLFYSADRLHMSAGDNLHFYDGRTVVSVYEIIAHMLSLKGLNKHYTFVIQGEYFLEVGPEIFRWEDTKWVKKDNIFGITKAIELVMQDKCVDAFDLSQGKWINANKLAIPELKKYIRFRLIKNKTVIVNGHEVPEPIKDAKGIKYEDAVWVVAPGRDELCYMTTKKHIRVQQLKKGLVHNTEEDARKFAQAMLDWSTK